MSDKPLLICENIKKTCSKLNLEFDFSVSEGDLVSVIGPSGSGRTCLLKLIAGLERPDKGSILIRDTNVTGLDPEKRKVAYIPATYALFPNMTVEQNIGYPMRMKKLPKDEIAAQTRNLVDLLHLEGNDKKRPSELSASEKYKVALARALASQPDILLLDEILSGLDSKERHALRNQIREIQKTTGTTTLFVTNSQEEALSISDRIILLNEGHIEQSGAPEEVYRRPVSEFSARFMGECNILPYDIILKTLRVPETERSKVIYQCYGPEHRLLFRPEDMVVNDMPGLPFPEFFPHLRFENARITRVEYIGKEYLVTAVYDDLVIKVYTVYKPASDCITAGIRMTKILEFNDGRLIRH